MKTKFAKKYALGDEMMTISSRFSIGTLMYYYVVIIVEVVKKLK